MLTDVFRELPVLAPILLLYLGLAFFRIDQQSFWTDEVASIKNAFYGEPLSTTAIWRSGHGPLYFVLLHFWLELGQTEFRIRSLSAILAIAAVCLIYALGLRLVDRPFAAVVSILLATSPFLIWYSQEARYITLAITTVLLSMYLFHLAVSTNSFPAWLLYSLTTILALFAFVPNAFVVMGQGIYVLCLRQRTRILRWVAYQSGVLVVFGTWLIIVYGGLTYAKTFAPGVEPDPVEAPTLETGTARELSLAVIPYTFFTLSSGFSVGPSVEELHISRDLASLIAHLPTLVPLALFFGFLFLFGIAQVWRQNLLGLILPWLVFPIMGVLGISTITDVAYNVRYVCAAVPAYIFILAAGVTKLRHRALQLSVLVVLVSVNGVSLAQYYFNPRYAKADARGAARYLESAGDPRDVILLVGNSAAFRHYYKGDLPVVGWGQAENSSRETIRKNVESLTDRYDRLWFVAIRPWEADPNSNVKLVLDQSLPKLHDLALSGVEIFSYASGRFGE
jgi:mannosyltransferase